MRLRGTELLPGAVVLTASLVLAALPSGAGQGLRPAAAPVPDPFGYRVLDQDVPGCGFSFLDIESTGNAISFTASGADPEDDDGGAWVALQAPFELYGEAITSVVVSSNGYLAAASTLVAEDGGDFSNDGILPAIPDNSAGVPTRVMAYHDELSGSVSGGTAYEQFFASCPRPSEALGAEACTVFQWTAWTQPVSGASFDLQAIAYHQSFEIVVQIRPVSGALDGGTIGIQDRFASVASQYMPDSALTGDTAICFFEPRFPSGGPVADVEVSNTNKFDVVTPGAEVVYEIGVLNNGPSPLTGLLVTDPVPASLVDCSWTCASSEGSMCNPAGSDDIDELVDLASQGWADYVLTCNAAATASTVVNTVTAVLPGGVTDPDPDNNSVTDIDAAGAGRLPNGVDLAGPLLELDRVGSELVLSWGSSCLVSDTDFAVYEGVLGSFSTHQPVTCGTDGMPDLSHALPAGSKYYLIVPRNPASEGSYGRTSALLERPTSASACRPQALGTCP